MSIISETSVIRVWSVPTIPDWEALVLRFETLFLMMTSFLICFIVAWKVLPKIMDFCRRFCVPLLLSVWPWGSGMLWSLPRVLVPITTSLIEELSISKESTSSLHTDVLMEEVYMSESEISSSTWGDSNFYESKHELFRTVFVPRLTTTILFRRFELAWWVKSEFLPELPPSFSASITSIQAGSF